MMEPDLLVCTPSYVEWLNEVGNENSTSDFNSIAELMDGVGSSADEMVLPEMMMSVVENTNGSSDTVQVEVEVHPTPPPSNNNRGRGKGSRGGRGKARGGRGGNCRRSARTPQLDVTEVIQSSTNILPSQQDGLTEVRRERQDKDDVEDTEETHAVDQLLEAGSNTVPNKVKKTLVDQLRNQFSFSQSNVLGLLECINRTSFSTIPLEKNQWHLLSVRNELKKLTGQIASSFSDQLMTVKKIEDLLATSIYKVNPLVLKKPFDPNIDNLSSKVIENAMKRK